MPYGKKDEKCYFIAYWGIWEREHCNTFFATYLGNGTGRAQGRFSRTNDHILAFRSVSSCLKIQSSDAIKPEYVHKFIHGMNSLYI